MANFQGAETYSRGATGYEKKEKRKIGKGERVYLKNKNGRWEILLGCQGNGIKGERRLGGKGETGKRGIKELSGRPEKGKQLKVLERVNS